MFLNIVHNFFLIGFTKNFDVMFFTFSRKLYVKRSIFQPFVLCTKFENHFQNN